MLDLPLSLSLTLSLSLFLSLTLTLSLNWGKGCASGNNDGDMTCNHGVGHSLVTKQGYDFTHIYISSGATCHIALIFVQQNEKGS